MIPSFSGNGNHGTVNGTLLNVSGRYGGAFRMNNDLGGNDYVEVLSPDFNFTTEDFTISVWMVPYVHAASGTNWRVLSNGLPNSEGYELFYRADSTLAFRMYNGSSNQAVSNNVIVRGALQHVVVVKNSLEIVFYVNGIDETASSPPIPVSIVQSPFPLAIGNRPGGIGINPFNGTLDEVAIYNRALSSEEVNKLYLGSKLLLKSGEGEPSDGLVGLWHFNGDPDNVTNAIDSSGQGNDGTIIGATFTKDGRFGGAYEFNGSTDYIEIISPDNSTTFDGSFSLSIWSKSSNRTGLPHHGVNVFGGAIPRLYLQGVSMAYGSGDFIDAVMTIPTGITDYSTWNHWVYMYNGSHEVAYVNGVLKASKNRTAEAVTVKIIGKVPSFFFNGTIDEVAIYNRALSAEEVNKLYQGSKIKFLS